MRVTLEPVAVVRVEAIWKTQTEVGSPPPFSVRLPVMPNVPEAEV
jgi:hypothetical protein